MRVGVTGGTGFIGRYFLRDFASRYTFVVATSQAAPKNPVPGVEYRQSDYSEDSFRSVFSGCDAVVHLGAKIPASVTAIGSFSDYLETVSSSENLLRALAKENIKKLVTLSSVSVYGKAIKPPFREDQPCDPDNCYGIAKAAVEMLVRLYSKEFGIRAAMLRVSQVLGYREYRSKGFYSVLQEHSYAHQKIPIFGSGAAARDYIYVKDVALAISCALERPEKADTYNIGAGAPTSNLQLAEAFCEAFQNNAGIEMFPAEKEDTRYWYMDIEKARQALGFTPQYDLLHMATDLRSEMEQARSGQSFSPSKP